jgi:uncharacterized protein YndB with AHSA1/START domain
VLPINSSRPPYTDAVEGAGTIERRIDLPRSIVWDALIDPVLVEGWLHPTARLLDGDVTEVIQPDPGDTAVLATSLEPFGHLRFELDELEGGTRGTSTLLRLRATRDGEPAGDWADRLDDLENLLRGHPVIWGERSNAERRAEGSG